MQPRLLVFTTVTLVHVTLVQIGMERLRHGNVASGLVLLTCGTLGLYGLRFL